MKQISALEGTQCVLAWVVPGVAVAQGSHRPGAARATALPFTGLDVVLLLVGCGALVIAGLIVRRVAIKLR